LLFCRRGPWLQPLLLVVTGWRGGRPQRSHRSHCEAHFNPLIHTPLRQHKACDRALRTSDFFRVPP
jgi:hypothetical protein